MGSSTEDTVYDCIGLFGGILLAYSQIPQIHHIHVRRSSEDISYTYQALFTIGLSMFVFYFAYYGLWPLFCTTSFSVFLSLYIGVLKIYLEECSSQRKARVDNDDTAGVAQDYTPGSALLRADHLAGQDARDSEIPNGDEKTDV